MSPAWLYAIFFIFGQIRRQAVFFFFASAAEAALSRAAILLMAPWLCRHYIVFISHFLCQPGQPASLTPTASRRI